MVTFLLGIAVLGIGYVVYGKIVENVFQPNAAAQTPAYAMRDNVDYVPISKWKAMALQLINIAGTGPIFGAIAGALFGPAAFLWIVFGCILAGAVHDYMIGMISLRHNGTNIAEIVGIYLGKKPRNIMRVFSLVLLIFVGVVFVTTPAQVLGRIFAPNAQTNTFLYVAVVCIIVYYILATLLPIDKILARLYPFFGAILVFMGVSMLVMLIISGDIRNIPEFTFQNMRPDKDTNILGRIFPFLFVTIACGAISGFHATQSPIVSRCLKNEKEGRMSFYGAMILEGVVAMIWAAVTMGHFNHVGNVAAVAAPVVVTESAIGYMGVIGGGLAVIGVALFPITSGDTAFRSARLIVADSLKIDQKHFKNRLAVALPLFAIGIPLVVFALASAKNFNIMWRYFAWSNQALATIALWAASAYLVKTGKNYWICLLPGTFMTVVVTAYFLTANEALGPLITRLSGDPNTTWIIGIVIGVVLAITLFTLFIRFIAIKQRGAVPQEVNA
ncbi:MAG: carbon starvation protein A [Treponema sp.]|nr:carbon starvation protein A [Treponema sp.]